MTAFKKYIRSKGIKTEEDYPFLPIELGTAHFVLESVIVDSENAKVKEVFTSGIGVIKFSREGEKTYDFI